MRVLGIDPGSMVTGFAVLDTGERGTSRPSGASEQRRKVNKGLTHVHSGSIRMPASESLPLRLARVYNALQGIIRDFEPDNAAIEDVFLAKNPRSALKLSHVRGVAMAVSALAGLNVYEYSPREVKQAVVGYGQASKLQVQKMVQALLCLDEMPAQDTSDALAVAICHINTTSMMNP